MKTTTTTTNDKLKAFEDGATDIIRRIFPEENVASLLRAGLQSFLLGKHSSPAMGMRSSVRAISFGSRGCERLDQLVSEVDMLYQSSGLAVPPDTSEETAKSMARTARKIALTGVELLGEVQDLDPLMVHVRIQEMRRLLEAMDKLREKFEASVKK